MYVLDAAYNYGVLVGEVTFFVLVWAAIAYWAGYIARKKGRSFGGFFALGLLLSLIGVLIAAVISPGASYAPPQRGQQGYPGQSTGPGSPPEHNPRFCKKCGTPLPSTSRFCPKCGAMTGSG